MTDHAHDVKILADEQWAIELLARETRSPLKKVQDLFLTKFARLTAHLHIHSFIPLLTINYVRAALDARNAAALSASVTQPAAEA